MDYGIGPSDITIEGDFERGQQYVPRARHLLTNLLTRMRVGGLQQGMDHWALDSKDGSYCYAIVAGSVRKAVIVVGAVSSDAGGGVRSYLAQIPDFLSGAVVGGTIPKVNPPAVERMTSFWPTQACADLHDMNPATQPSIRLAVEPYGPFADDLGYKGEAPLKYSQYVRLKPTMYSGLMRNVVQFLMGFGKQSSPSIYDKAKPKIHDPNPPVPPRALLDRKPTPLTLIDVVQTIVYDASLPMLSMEPPTAAPDATNCGRVASPYPSVWLVISVALAAKLFAVQFAAGVTAPL